MRISDWSSDVCSSDLNMPETCAATFNPRRNLDMRSGVPEKSFPSLFSGRDCESRRCPLRSAWRVYAHAKLETRGGREVARRDGKSVGVGKSVSVSVDVVGGRRMKKKNHK